MHSVTQLCLTLVTPWTVACQALLSMEIIPARILEWVAISFSRGSSQPRGQTHISCIFCTSKLILYHWVTCTFLNLWLVFVQELASLRGPDLCTLILCLSTRWCSGKESRCQCNAAKEEDRSFDSFPLGNGNPLQYSFHENSMDRETWKATVHEVAKRWTQSSDWACTHTLAELTDEFNKVYQ